MSVTSPATVTLESWVLRLTAKPGAEAHVDRIMDDVCADARSALGFIDLEQAVMTTGTREREISFTFVSARHLANWRQSPLHRSRLVDLQPYVEDDLHIRDAQGAPRDRAWHAEPFAMFRWPPRPMVWWQRLLLVAALTVLFILLLPLIAAGAIIMLVATLILRKRIEQIMRRPFR